MKRITGPASERVLDEPERVERSQPLEAGHYWKAKRDVKDQAIPGGCVLLLQRIKRVDGIPHTIELAGHPLLHPHSTFDFLVADFLRRFEPEPRGPAIRQEEMAALRAQVDEKQRGLLTFQTDISALLAEVAKNPALPAPKRRSEEDLPTAAFDLKAGLPGADFRPSTSIATLAEGRDREQAALLRRQAENQAILAKKRAEIIEAKTTEIATIVKQMTPFYEEMGAVALAQSADAIEVYKKLRSGLATLGLYTGEDVELHEVRSGEPAPADEKIAVFQALLFMDEESLIRVEEGGAQFGSFEEFLELLAKDDALLDRLIPSKRGLVGMRYVHEMKEHAKGTDPFTAARIDEENARCFFVIRSGERVHVARSEVLANIDRLFPTQSDLDQPFTTDGWWHGIESERITVEDVEFSDARSKFDRLVLHYRRILIMLAGLIDREPKVFGEIAALRGKHGLSLLSLPIQEEVFLSISDEERALADGRPAFWAWLDEKNAVAQSGSRLICNWRTLMTRETAPGAVFESSGRHAHSYFRSEPTEDFSLAIARREHRSVIVDCPVEKRRGIGEDFNARVDVSAFDRGDGRLGYLCLDDVPPEEVDYYIRRRHERRGYINYVRLLFAAKRIVEADAIREAPLRRTLIDAMMAGGVRIHGAEDSRAVATVIRTWRAAHRGAPVPMEADADHRREWDSMARQLWVLAGKGRDRKATAEEIAAAEGRKPLRLALTGKKRLVLYATPTEAEREDLLGPHPWVARIALEELKTKVSILDRRQVLLRKNDPREHVLHEWEAAAEHVDPEVHHGLGCDQVRALRKLGALAAERAQRWLAPKSDAEFAAILEQVKIDTRARSTRFISHGVVYFPLAVGRQTRKSREWDGEKHVDVRTYKYHVGGLSVLTYKALAVAATKAQRRTIADWFRSYYNEPEHALARLKEKDQGSLFWMEVNNVAAVAPEIGSGGEASVTARGKSWAKDLQVLLGKIKTAGYYSADSSEIVLQFAAEAEAIYALLAGREAA